MSLDLEALEEPIARILSAPGTDLSTISAKRVRKALLQDSQYAYLGLTPAVLKTQREDVDEVIARIYNDISQGASSGGGKRKRAEDDDGEEGEEEGEGLDGDVGEGDAEPSEDVQESEDGVKSSKKKKGKKSVEESDAVLARKLSTEINSRSRRSTSAAGASGPRKARRKPKKSAETVESEVEEVKPKKRSAAKGGFAKEYTLSVPLAAVLAVEKLSRPQVVKKLWEYIRRNELQNPSNKREIVCDNALRAVFSVDKIDMFRMNKVLGQHLHEG